MGFGEDLGRGCGPRRTDVAVVQLPAFARWHHDRLACLPGMRAAILASWLAAMPCGGGGPHPDAAPDAPTRTYRLASAAVQLDPAAGPVFTDPDLAGDVDVVNVHQDFFGVPWTDFAADRPPPPAWAARMTGLAQDSHATGKDIFLALAPLDGDRSHLAPDAVASASGFDLVHAWKPACYNLATEADGDALRTAYSRYVDYMVHLFQPRWTNVAVEVSLFHVTCAAAWDGMVALERDAYAAAKRAAPGPAFPSIQIDALYGRAGCSPPRTAAQCYEIDYAAIAGLSRDRFAISTYPYNFAGFPRPEDVPPDYLSRAAARAGEPLVIAETGWLATDVIVTDQNLQCLTAVTSSPAAQAAYFDRVLTDAIAHDVELVTWISNRDFLAAPVMTDCPCTFSQPWCDLVRTVRGQGTPTAQRDAEVGLKIFGTMGIRDHDGAPRQPIFDHWTQARSPALAP